MEDFWIIVFAGLAFIAILGWLANCVMWYRMRQATPPPFTGDRELQERLQTASALIGELQTALTKVIEDLPAESSYFNSHPKANYGFHRMDSRD